eukprot:1195571-Prorocentrum_minimum.AAC.4
MGRPIIYDVIERPISSVVICVCTCVWVYLNGHSVGYEHVGFSYHAVVHNGEYWRCISATFSHISILHLIFNMTSLWSLGVVEGMAAQGLGEIVYLKYTLVLIVMPLVLVLAIYHALIRFWKKEEYVHVTAVGYSCVVFGWMTIIAQLHPTHQIQFLGLLSLPMSLAPFGSLVFTSIIVPQASFVGHLAGILVGYLIAWSWFDWIDGYTTFVLYVCGCLGVLYNLKQTNHHGTIWSALRQTTSSDLMCEGGPHTATPAPPGSIKKLKNDYQARCKTARQTDLHVMLAGPKGREVGEISGELDTREDP